MMSLQEECQRWRAVVRRQENVIASVSLNTPERVELYENMTQLQYCRLLLETLDSMDDVRQSIHAQIECSLPVVVDNDLMSDPGISIGTRRWLNFVVDDGHDGPFRPLLKVPLRSLVCNLMALDVVSE